MDISDSLDARACKWRCRPTDCADGKLNKSTIGNKPTVLVADDTDILIPLCYHWVRAPRGVYSSSQNLAKLPRSNQGFCDISVVKSTLGPGVYNNILFVHAFFRCDTTSSVYGSGKSAALTLIHNNKDFEDQAKILAVAVDSVRVVFAQFMERLKETQTSKSNV